VSTTPEPTSRFDKLILPGGALTCALLWGSSFPVIKLTYAALEIDTMGERLAFAGNRFWIAGLVLLVFIPNRFAKLRGVPTKGRLIAVGALQVVVQYVLFYWGMALNPGVLNAILNATASFWWVLLAPLFGTAGLPRGSQWALLAMGFAGVCVAVITPDASLGVSPLGTVLMLGATLAAATATLLIPALGKAVAPPLISGFSLTWGGLVLSLAAPAESRAYLIEPSTIYWAATLWLALVSAVAFSLFYYLVSRFDLTTLSGYRFLIPICGAVESALFIPGERLGFGVVVGGALVISAITILERVRRRPVATLLRERG